MTRQYNMNEMYLNFHKEMNKQKCHLKGYY